MLRKMLLPIVLAMTAGQFVSAQMPFPEQPQALLQEQQQPPQPQLQQQSQQNTMGMSHCNFTYPVTSTVWRTTVDPAAATYEITWKTTASGPGVIELLREYEPRKAKVVRILANITDIRVASSIIRLPLINVTSCGYFLRIGAPGSWSYSRQFTITKASDSEKKLAEITCPRRLAMQKWLEEKKLTGNGQADPECMDGSNIPAASVNGTSTSGSTTGTKSASSPSTSPFKVNGFASTKNATTNSTGAASMTNAGSKLVNAGSTVTMVFTAMVIAFGYFM